jgi:transposase InsO family protein
VPGSPWKNGYCESFNRHFRDELLNGKIFYSLKEAQIIIEQFCFESMNYIGSTIPVTASMATVGARRLKVLEDEKAKLKKLLAEQMQEPF